MCGLGVLIEPGRDFDDALLAGMDRDLFHRGPDSGGRLSETSVAMVFRRLAILDPTPGSDQPMTDPTGRCTLVFNGEIYNYRQLRLALAQQGVVMRTDGDTEVILQGYLTWGEGILDRLEGMYAFVLFDRHRNCVVAARDPFGIKPLYLMRRGQLVALASEMRPFARLAAPEPDPDAMAELLTFYWAAGPLSNLKGVERVPGGTVLRVSLADGAIHRRRFCDPLDTLTPDPTISASESEQLAANAVHDSVRAHLVSDVGYALQLSGGVDSSLIAALVRGQDSSRLDTFGIHLAGYAHDEAPYREAVAGRYALTHHEAAFSGRDFADALPRALAHIEGPSTHLGCVFLMKLCDRIRETSKVVLTGEGGDEMFGGYLRYGQWRKLAWQERLGHVLPRRLWPSVRPFKGVRRFAGVDAAVFASVYDEPEVIAAIFPDIEIKRGARDAASRRFDDFRDRMLAVDQVAYLESLLIRQDKLAMSASVEARVPFVHLPLARVVNRLPREVRIPGDVTKPLLKKVAESYLPHDLIYRRKIGLWLPFAEWLRDAEGLGRYLEYLVAPDSRLAVFADRDRLRCAVEDFRANRGPTARTIIKLVNLEVWLRGLAPAPA